MVRGAIVSRRSGPSLITGGAGFIGSSLADRLLSQGRPVRIFDSFGRRGSEHNKGWLEDRHGGLVEFVRGDVRDASAVSEAVAGVDAAYHLAAQVAVTTSVLDPRDDFDTNATGTLNVLEAARRAKRPPTVLFASTNKVYGGMEEVRVAESNGRYAYQDLPLGVAEHQPLDFHSPYGCSKGAADQYVVDYARIYGLKTLVFRMSCIYGTRQFGNEDQGWVAHFAISAILGRPLTIYGDGKQVRDVLFVDDLLDAYEAAVSRADDLRGQVFNLGGGPDNVLSILELVAHLEARLGHSIKTNFEDWRPGDQRVYVTDVRKARRSLGWRPKVHSQHGVDRMIDWVLENKAAFHFASEDRV